MDLIAYSSFGSHEYALRACIIGQDTISDSDVLPFVVQLVEIEVLVKDRIVDP